MAPLINNVPTPRVFDEMLKLLMSGHALACLQQLRKEGLHHGLLPLLDVVLEQPMGEKFVTLALANHRRARAAPASRCRPASCSPRCCGTRCWESGRPIRPPANTRFRRCTWRPTTCCDAQTDTLALQRRIASDMRDIWAMQPRFERRTGKAPYRLLEHRRLRAGYDFLLLRCASGEIDAELGDWWTAFIDADGAGREELLAQKPKGGSGGPAKKRPRRRSPRKPAADGAPQSQPDQESS